MSFIPNTDADRPAMLEAVGVGSVAELFHDVPAEHRFPRIDLPAPLAEQDVLRELDALSRKNADAGDAPCFLGAGAYRHFIPSVVDFVVSRSEFATAYTPYQPEISQGTLQAIFEYQSMIARLTGMEVSNASHYDGATSTAEAVIMALNVAQGQRKRVVLSAGLQSPVPGGCAHVRTGHGSQRHGRRNGHEPRRARGPVRFLHGVRGRAEPRLLRPHHPASRARRARREGPCVRRPARCRREPDLPWPARCPRRAPAWTWLSEKDRPWETRSPSAARTWASSHSGATHIRKSSGRIAGETVDRDGLRGYVFTLSTREQHIRREKATSNICTNQSLNALAAAVYLAALGPRGLQKVAELCWHKAHYAANRIAGLPGWTVHTEEFFHEFAVRCPLPVPEINRRLSQRHGIIGGYDLSRDFPDRKNEMLLCFTEMNSRDEIDQLVTALSEVGHG